MPSEHLEHDGAEKRFIIDRNGCSIQEIKQSALPRSPEYAPHQRRTKRPQLQVAAETEQHALNLLKHRHKMTVSEAALGCRQPLPLFSSLVRSIVWPQAAHQEESANWHTRFCTLGAVLMLGSSVGVALDCQQRFPYCAGTGVKPQGMQIGQPRCTNEYKPFLKSRLNQ
jgi:hypothetical protein